MLLKLGGNQAEFLAEARHSDSKIRIFIGIFLRIAKHFCIDGIELNIAETDLTCRYHTIGKKGYISVRE